MATGGSKQNTKLFIAVGLLIVAGIVIFLQLRSGGGAADAGNPALKPMSEAQRLEHERQVKAAEAAQRGAPNTPPATTGGAN